MDSKNPIQFGLPFAVTAGRRYAFRYGIVYETDSTNTGISLGVLIPTFAAYGAQVCIHDVGYLAEIGDRVATSWVQHPNRAQYAWIEGAICPTADGTIEPTYAYGGTRGTVLVRQGSYGTLTVLDG